MMTKLTTILGPLVFAGITLGGSGCPAPKTDPVILRPTTLPPQPPIVVQRCASGEYLRGGKHVWRANRWQWLAPRCTSRPATWRDGCVWVRGRWRRQDARIVYHRGSLTCHAAPAPRRAAAAHPSALPPPPPSGAITCGSKQYLKVGRYVWKQGSWRWLAGSCTPRPKTWRTGCKWQRGRWHKTSTGLRFTPGNIACPK